MILCIEEAHKMKWIHRDIKPDNFLIGADGHLKISDFGLAFDGRWEHDQKYFHRQRHSLVSELGVNVEGDAEDQKDAARRHPRQGEGREGHEIAPSISDDKLCAASKEKIVDWRNKNQRRKLARSVVGTSQYMAPEVIRGEQYDGRCDWWSVGIIMYECLFGFTPFACEDRQHTKLKILRHKETLYFPNEHEAPQPVSSEALDVMMRILVEKETRVCTRRYELNDYTRKFFGSGTRLIATDKTHRNYNGFFVYPNDAEDIRNHPFFLGIPWVNMQDYNPPFTPRVQNWEDTKYFDGEGPVSNIDSATSKDDSEALETDKHPLNPNCHQPEPQGIVPLAPGKEDVEEAPILICMKHERPKEKKRPRDKILRDADYGKTALKMRKDTAFIGYEYRRSKTVTEVIEEALANEEGFAGHEVVVGVNGQS